MSTSGAPPDDSLAIVCGAGNMPYRVADAVIDRVSIEGDFEKAKAILVRKYREPATTREEKAKRARFLQSRGFSYEIIRKLLSTGDE